MNLIDLILKLLRNTVGAETKEYSQIHREAHDWYDNIYIDDSEDNKTNPMLKKLKKFFEQWYVKVVLGFVFIWATRQIKFWMLDDVEDSDYETLED